MKLAFILAGALAVAAPAAAQHANHADHGAATPKAAGAVQGSGVVKGVMRRPAPSPCITLRFQL